MRTSTKGKSRLRERKQKSRKRDDAAVSKRPASRSARAPKPRSRLSAERVGGFVSELVGDGMHAKRRLSLAMGIVGVMHAVSLAIHAIGRGLASAMDLDAKHTTKQVDRLLSNERLEMSTLLPAWVEYVVGERKEVVVALDWTEFDGDNQSVLALYLVTRHGRATPLVWKSVYKNTLKNNRFRYETELIELLHGALAGDVAVTLLADRGFGDVARYSHLDGLKWSYVIRFKQGTHVTHAGESKPASSWMSPTGRARKLNHVEVTGKKKAVGAVVLVHAKKMKDPWCLATNRDDWAATKVIKLYGRRFTIEETFRDTKDVHFGLGLSATHISKTDRRERLLFLGAIAHALLTLLGAAGERCGLDSRLKVNTVKHRTLSLYRQGCYWYDALPNMREERVEMLVAAFDEEVNEHSLFREIFGVL